MLTTAKRHGTVDPAATDLLDQAGDVVRAVAEGHSEEARKRLEDLERKTEELIQKGQISPTATGRVRPSCRPVQPGGAPLQLTTGRQGRSAADGVDR